MTAACTVIGRISDPAPASAYPVVGSYFSTPTLRSLNSGGYCGPAHLYRAAFLGSHHGGDSDDRLCHRGEAEDGTVCIVSPSRSWKGDRLR